MKIFLFVLSFLVLLSVPSFTYADIEEDTCFELLNTAVKNDSRFKDPKILKSGDLSRVLINESNNTLYDFSKYNYFYDKRAYEWYNEPANSGSSLYYFDARRNNIGTIIAEKNYIISQISWFGRDSNFDFPLSANSWTLSFGDKYKLNGQFFKEYVLYTHHLNSSPYDLLSCGIVKIIPLWERSFSEVNESWYMTNILEWISNQSVLWNKKCSSGFEGSPVEKNGKQFYQMKANVCVIDYAQTDYLKIEVISLAYNNGSTRLNEYYTHPMQVEAMKNNKNHAEWLKWIQDVFRDMLYDKTCFSVIHGDVWNLPSSCNGQYGGLISYKNETKNFFSAIFETIFPQAAARLNVQEPISDEPVKDTGMVAQWNIPYVLYKKLQTIPDEWFRDYLLLSVVPNYEQILESKKSRNILLSPYEETFLSCWIPYAERLEIVKNFLTDYKQEDFSLLNLLYSNKKFWDCIIPYPDKSHISTVIEWSFDSNKLLAEKLSWIYKEGEVSPEMLLYFQQRDEILAQYNKKVSDIEKDFNSWMIDANQYQVLVSESQVNFENAINELVLWDPVQNLNEENTSSWQKNDTEEKTIFFSQKVQIIIVIVFLILSGIWIIIYTVLSQRKSNNIPK